jgi:hypothetical protein
MDPPVNRRVEVRRRRSVVNMGGETEGPTQVRAEGWIHRREKPPQRHRDRILTSEERQEVLSPGRDTPFS